MEMREKIDMISYLPEGAGDPMVIQMDINMMPVLLLAVSGDRPLEELKTLPRMLLSPVWKGRTDRLGRSGRRADGRFR